MGVWGLGLLGTYRGLGAGAMGVNRGLGFRAYRGLQASKV